MIAISATEAWRTAHPGATIGLLEVSGVCNAVESQRLNVRKREIEARLRQRYEGFTRQQFLELRVMNAYDRYYTRFNKTYHVQLQLESIVVKRKSLPEVSPAVDANFMAEVETLILTAGHDVRKLGEPITIDVSREDERMTPMTGAARVIRAGDMVMRDAEGICWSIIYGQDSRSPISRETSHILYVAYAPTGVPGDAVDRHLGEIEANLRLVADIVVEQRRLLAAGARQGMPGYAQP
jgi:DNA/RNA-binding domain of Phe-tRNA-synthetase-like protein